MYEFLKRFVRQLIGTSLFDVRRLYLGCSAGSTSSKRGLVCGRTFFLKKFEHNSSRLEYNVGILRSDKDSLYDDDGLIIFNALDWILSISLDRYSGML